MADFARAYGRKTSAAADVDRSGAGRASYALGRGAIQGANALATEEAAMTQNIVELGRGTANFATSALGDAARLASQQAISDWKYQFAQDKLDADARNFYGDIAAVEHPADRAPSYGMNGHIVGGQDVVAVYEVATEAVARARAGEGPSFIEVQTYRIGGHSSTNPETYYMDEPEIERERERDPLVHLRARILGDGAASTEALDDIESETDAQADDAVKRALEAPFPDESVAFEGVYA